jgi:hypothetical protein
MKLRRDTLNNEFKYKLKKCKWVCNGILPGFLRCDKEIDLAAAENKVLATDFFRGVEHRR